MLNLPHRSSELPRYVSFSLDMSLRTTRDDYSGAPPSSEPRIYIHIVVTMIARHYKKLEVFSGVRHIRHHFVVMVMWLSSKVIRVQELKVR